MARSIQGARSAAAPYSLSGDSGTLQNTLQYITSYTASYDDDPTPRPFQHTELIGEVNTATVNSSALLYHSGGSACALYLAI